MPSRPPREDGTISRTAAAPERTKDTEYAAAVGITTAEGTAAGVAGIRLPQESSGQPLDVVQHVQSGKSRHC